MLRQRVFAGVPDIFSIHVTMQTADELNDAFGIPECVTFDTPEPGMPRVRIATAACTAELYLQGAHLTQWAPRGQQEVLFLSKRSAYSPGKAIRGGIPVIFPWFGAGATSPVHPPQGSPAHGFARNWPWTLRFAALAGDDLHLSLTLDHHDRLHAKGFDQFQLGADLILGRQLTVSLTALNTTSGEATQPILLEEALHAYLLIGDIHQVYVEGLAGTEYLDKTDDFRRKHQVDSNVRFLGETDRPYLNAPGPVTLVDPVLRRCLTVTKTNSQSTVLWNPAERLAATLTDLAAGDWQHFACVEAGNVADNAVSLAAGEARSMSMHLAVSPL